MTIIRDMPSEAYHGSPYLGSTTAVLALTSLKKLGRRLAGTDPVADRTCFQIGRLAHMMALEPEKLKGQLVPHGPINEKTGKPYGRDTKAFAEWQSYNPDKIVAEPWLTEMLDEMPDGVRSTFRSGLNEASLFVDDPAHNGLAIKCRPDCWQQNANTCYDLKTIAQVDGDFNRAIDRAIVQRRYWFSAAWYRYVLRCETGEQHAFSMIFAEKGSPYRWRIVDLDEDLEAYGDQVVADLLPQIAASIKSGIWTDPEPLYHLAHMPAWMMDAGELHEDEDGDFSL